ncbi:aminoglycoside phosphotransferase family protein [Olivibacter domesticus]|uniref:Streptomycin 6-kinase n=1 Tax=Olivibacter domesticus TaxID=407022 RepID=A0A1H7IWI1_OLID1|nr:aminoglycoside phosphotransferase family protein [Olivibacter domesticus]SEK66883.1 streptomycin 6-kinase [Olivibacter domesticus]
MTRLEIIEAKRHLKYCMELWKLKSDEKSFISTSSLLQRVTYRNLPAMIKVPIEPEEKWGSALMTWWDGDGAAKVYNQWNDVILMERIDGHHSLVDLVKRGADDDASKIICTVAKKLHQPRRKELLELIPLEVWFKELFPAARRHGGVLEVCSLTARELLDQQEQVTVLHGDLHHKNVLFSEERGWLAIDPKRLIGEFGFDYANIFCNPDIETALKPGRLAKQLEVVAKEADLSKKRLLKWIIAWGGLSATWLLNDGGKNHLDLRIVEIAIGELEL